MTEKLSEDILKIISKKIIEQYEAIRRFGVCNMFDFYSVHNISKQLKFYDLAKLNYDQYCILLQNFGKLMKYYNVQQITNTYQKDQGDENEL